MGYEVELPQGLIRWLRKMLNILLTIGSSWAWSF